MADRPITFSGPMVRSMLADLKTQTRRGLVLRKYGKVTEFGPSDTPGYDWHFRDKAMRWHDITHARLLELLPYQIGDRLYVREHWRTVPGIDDMSPKDMIPHLMPIRYEADEGRTSIIDTLRASGRFRQAMHMPKWASRLTLHVGEVRVQRLKDISANDAMAEGVMAWVEPSKHFTSGYGVPLDAETTLFGKTAPDAYFNLWEYLHGQASLDANPWVTATTFEVERCHIDQARAA